VQTLSEEEKINLDTFSHKSAVKELYNKVGFTPLENGLVQKYFSKKGSVLDIGCGTGRTTIPLKQSGYDVIGIDYSTDMIEFAMKKHSDIDFRVMNACELEFPDEHFEYALFSFNGIDNISPYEKRLRCLSEVHRVLKKGGIFIYSSHNALCLPTTRILLGMVRRNLFSLRLFGRYREEESVTGKLIQYYGIPFLEKQTTSKMGFSEVKTGGRKFSREPLVTLLELSPYYVIQKK
jgi:ubiquinone/menaquinone biosynthesis C-methylase UbiE